MSIIYLFIENSKQMIDKEAHKSNIKSAKDTNHCRMSRVSLKMLPICNESPSTEGKEEKQADDKEKHNQIQSKSN